MIGLKEMVLGASPRSPELLWLQRRETWNGDRKANFIRVCALAFFALNEFFNFHVLHIVDRNFHIGSLLVLFLWFLAALLFDVVLKNHWFPQGSSYLPPAMDALLLTWLLFLGDGPRSPLVAVYFLIIALSGLRLSPKIVRYTGAVCAVGFLAAWDFAKHQRPAFLVPGYHLVIVAVSLLLCAVIVSSLIERVFALLESFPGGGRRD